MESEDHFARFTSIYMAGNLGLELRIMVTDNDDEWMVASTLEQSPLRCHQTSSEHPSIVMYN